MKKRSRKSHSKEIFSWGTARRAPIIAAAGCLIAKNGYPRTTSEMELEKAGVSPEAINYPFGSQPDYISPFSKRFTEIS
jgi:AcrR family transcriptional regulator